MQADKSEHEPVLFVFQEGKKGLDQWCGGQEPWMSWGEGKL